MKHALALVSLTACGRLNFEPIGDDAVTADAAVLRICGPAYQGVAGLTSKYRDGTNLDWFAAEAACESDGGNLVVIESQQENAYVTSFFTGPPIWIGMSDHLTEGTMRWVTGDPVAGFDSFKPGEPNNEGGVEDCGRMIGASGEWNDVGCRSGPADYVCECDQRAVADTYCDTEQSANCGECGKTCDQACTNQICGGGGGGG